MDPFGLVVRDQDTFFTKVVNLGMEQGIFTRDRADEIIRISVAMANKYVLEREVDFRSTEKLEGVQETILKIIGIGLEIKSNADLDEGLRLLLEGSPVEMFRLAYTRIERARHRWQLLRQNDRVPIFVAPEEYECLDDVSCQLLAQMSIFSVDEISTIESLTLEDRLFSDHGILEYYESEIEKYEFILRLKEILPFQLLNQSPSLRAENLSEVDSIREALVNTVVVSGVVGSPDPVTVSLADIDRFLQALDLSDSTDMMPAVVEDALLDVIHELGEGLDEREATLLTREIIGIARKFMDTVGRGWETLTTGPHSDRLKRWCRLVIVADMPDILGHIQPSDQEIDDLDFEILLEKLSKRPPDEALSLIGGLPWDRFLPDQVIRLFHDLTNHQVQFAENAALDHFNAVELVDLLEILTEEALQVLLPKLIEKTARSNFELEDLEIIAGLPHDEATILLRAAGPPSDYDKPQILREYVDASQNVRRALLVACWDQAWFPELFQEAWDLNPDFVKRFAKSLPLRDTGPFLEAAAQGAVPKIVKPRNKEPEVRFKAKELNTLFKYLPKNRQRAAVKYFTGES